MDGAPFTQIPLTADQADVMTTVDLGSLATVGAHAIALRFTVTGKVSYNLVTQHNLPWSSLRTSTSTSAAGTGPLTVSVAYDRTHLALDETVTVRNNTHGHQDMILVTVGLPPGFQVETADLDAYEARQLLSSYELTGKPVILYVSALGADALQDFVYRLTATMPVKVSDGGAEATLYYQPDQKTTAPATLLEVTSM